MNTLYIWLRLLAVLVALQFQLGSNTILAQESAGRPRAVVFNIHGKRLAERKLLSKLRLPKGMAGGNLFAAKKLYGAFSLPGSIEDVMEMHPTDPPPVDLLIVGEFDSKEDRERLISDAMVEDFLKTEFNGKSYYLAPNADDLLLSVEEKGFVGGSKAYLGISRAELPPLKVRTVLRDIIQLRDPPAWIAVDLTQDRQFLIDVIGMLKKQRVPPMFAPYMDLPKKIDQLWLSFDPDAAEMLVLGIRSASEEDAAFVKKALDSVLGLAKMGLGQAPKDDPSAAIMSELISNVQVSQAKEKVALIISKPAGFDEALAKSMVVAEQAAGEMQRLNNVKQMLLTMHNYHAAFNRLPFRHEVENRISLEISWRVKVLPYLEQNDLYSKFDISEPWDSDANKTMSAECPSLLGKNGKSIFCWVESDARRFRDVTDGLANTICIIEVPDGVPWTQPVDVSVEDAEKLILGQPDGEFVVVGLYDGSVHKMDNKSDKETLRALLTINGGEEIGKF